LTCIVTGASSGKGLETTSHLVKKGGHEIITYRRSDTVVDVAKSFNDKWVIIG
jgi:NADP-dependent 3-hydroxy acid dehydrogenase YdfG